jgi:hypothetical protein
MKIIGLSIMSLVAIPLASCGGAPRDQEYFSAHLSEAAHVVAECRGGTITGRECSDADAALKTARGADQKMPFGDPSKLPGFGNGY